MPVVNLSPEDIDDIVMCIDFSNRAREKLPGFGGVYHQTDRTQGQAGCGARLPRGRVK